MLFNESTQHEQLLQVHTRNILAKLFENPVAIIFMRFFKNTCILQIYEETGPAQ